MTYPYEISVVIPVMNEEDNIQPMLDKLSDALNRYSYEVLFVDDGSTDETIPRLMSKVGNGIKLVELMKNYGQSSAIQAGIDQAQGQYIVTMDGDLQNDPADIPMMLDTLKKENVDLVAGERVNRKDGMFIRKIPSKIANSIIRSSTNVKIRDYGCTLKVFKSKIAKGLNLYGELHRFIPVLASLQGARIHQVPVNHSPRIHGKTKYGLNRTFKVVSDLILMVFMKKYFVKPMHLFGSLGVFIFSFGVAINLYLLVLKLMGQDIWGRPMLILGVVLLLGGIQLITIGIMAELQMRTYYESQDKKIYNIRSINEGSSE